MEYIQNIILNNTKSRYELELEYTDDETIKKEILNIISKLDKPMQNKIETFDNKINQLEQLSMKKQFYRLKTPQKINLLKQYFISKNVDLDKIEAFAQNIIELIDDDKIKNKDIEYDIENIKITNINKIELIDNELTLIKTKAKPQKKEKKDEEQNNSDDKEQTNSNDQEKEDNDTNKTEENDDKVDTKDKKIVKKPKTNKTKSEKEEKKSLSKSKK
jgi:hypothetical protein